MLRTATVAVALLFIGTLGDECSCGERERKYSISTPMIVITNPTKDGKPSSEACTASCHWDAFSGDEKRGHKSLQFYSYAIGDSSISIYDNDFLIETFDAKKYPTMGSANVRLNGYSSFTPYIRINFNQTNSVGKFMLGMQESEGLATPPSSTTTTTVIPTTKYHGDFRDDPRKISDDIIFVFDVTTEEAMLEKLKNFAASIVSQLETSSERAQIRLSTISSFDGFATNFAPNWQYTTVELFKQQIPGVLHFGNASADRPLHSLLETSAYKTFFNDARSHSTRYFIYFASLGFKKTDSKTPPINFEADGVQAILIDANIPQSDLKEIQDIYHGAWTVYEFDDNMTIDDHTLKFINNYLQDADHLSCQVEKNNLTRTLDSNKATIIKIPGYYEGRPDHGWGSKKHYCNYQTTSIKIMNAGDSTEMCFKVYYELETDADFVKISSGVGDTVVSLTGYDVSGATFEVPVNAAKGEHATITFTSDHKLAFDGFYASVSADPCLESSTPGSS